MTSVFIIDDNDDFRFLCEKFLLTNGFEVKISAKNGKEGINMFKAFSKKPDIILLDYCMPGLNGFKTAKEILKIDNNAKIIIITSADLFIDDILELGVLRVVKKVSFIRDLVETIREIIDN